MEADYNFFSYLNPVIDLIRHFKYVIWEIGNCKILGLPCDFLLHFFISVLLFYFLQKRYTLKKSFPILLSLILVKEFIDVFLKSRVDYIRPPGLDVLGDVLFGLAGMGLIFFLKKYRVANQNQSILERLEINLMLAVKRSIKHAFSSMLLILVIGILLATFLSTYAILFGTRMHLAETIHPFQVSSQQENDRYPMTTVDCFKLIEKFKPYIHKVSFNLASYLPVKICLDTCNLTAEFCRLSEPDYNLPPVYRYIGEPITAESLFYDSQITILLMSELDYRNWGHKAVGKELSVEIFELGKRQKTYIAGIYVTDKTILQGYVSPFFTPDFFNMTIDYLPGTSYQIILEMVRYLENQAYGNEVPLPVIARAYFIQLQITQFNRLFLFWTATIILIGFITLTMIFYRITVRRFSEIGIRKIEGALTIDIFMQFFFDYFFLFFIGCLIGSIFGLTMAVLSQKIAHHEYIKAQLPVNVLFSAMVATLFLGFFSILIPTRKAINVLPAEIIRYE